MLTQDLKTELEPLDSAEPDFELAIAIDIPSSALHAFLCDLHCYVQLHPLIESIQDLPPLAALPNARFYRVIDRIPIGPVKLKAVYQAALDPASDFEVHGYAWQSPGIRLRTEYVLSKVDGGTRLVERCQIETHFLLRRFVVAWARKAHAKTLEEMKRLLEGGDLVRG